MIKELKEKFDRNNEYMHFSESYSVISDYYSEDGTLLENPTNAYIQKIRVIYDIISISNVDNSKRSSMLLTATDQTKFSKVLETVDVNDVSKLIEKVIKAKINKVDLQFHGPSDSIVVTSGLVLKMFNFFKEINIDIGNLEYNKIELPNGEFKVVSFSITGGTTILPQKFIMETKKSLNISDSTLICEEIDNPHIQLVGKNVYLNELSFTQPVKMVLGSPKQNNVDSFKETSIRLMNLNFNLEGFDGRDTTTSNGVFETPIVAIESNANTEVFDSVMTGGDFRKFIRVSGVKDLFVSGLKRISKSINTYSLGLDSIRSTKISNVELYGEVLSKLEPNFIAFNSSSVTVTDTININKVYLHNCGLVSLDGLGFKEFLVYDCTFDGKTFITSKNNNVSKVSFRNANIILDSEFSIEGNSIEFIDSYIKSDKNDIKILSKENIKIFNSRIICDKNDILMKLEDNCSVFIKNSDIYAKNYIVDKTEKDDSPLVNIVESTSVKRVKIDTTNLKLSGKFSVVGADNQIYSDIRFSNVSEINISDTTLSSKLFVLDVDKPVPINFSKIIFKNTVFASVTSPSRIPISILDSSGDLFLSIKDSYNDDRTNCVIDFNCVRSKLGCTFNSDLLSVKAKISSSECQGSCFFGGENVTVVPEIKSKDINDFERVSTFTKKHGVVNYGNV